MKKLIDYLNDVGAELVCCKGGVIIDSQCLDKVDVAKVQELCPAGFFVNPSITPSAKTILKCQADGKPVPSPTIGIFAGGNDNDPLAHLIALGEKASS